MPAIGASSRASSRESSRIRGTRPVPSKRGRSRFEVSRSGRAAPRGRGSCTRRPRASPRASDAWRAARRARRARTAVRAERPRGVQRSRSSSARSRVGLGRLVRCRALASAPAELAALRTWPPREEVRVELHVHDAAARESGGRRAVRKSSSASTRRVSGESRAVGIGESVERERRRVEPHERGDVGVECSRG